MKKALSLLLVIALLLPVAALAEQTVDLGFGTLTVDDGDLVMLGEKAENVLLVAIYPAYRETDAFHDSINVTWTAGTLTGLDGDPGEFGMNAAAAGVQGVQAENIAVSNAMLLDAALDPEEGSAVVIYCLDADYTARGQDLQLTLYYCQLFLTSEDEGTYVVTATAGSVEGMDLLMAYIDRIETDEEAAQEAAE